MKRMKGYEGKRIIRFHESSLKALSPAKTQQSGGG